MSLIEFQDYPSTETPLNAENLNHNFNELNQGNTYSTEETFTGKYWIDGKKIYRKVVQNIIPNGTFGQELFNATYIENIISYRGIYNQENTQIKSINFYFSTNDFMTLNFVLMPKRILLDSTSNYANKGTIQIILEYTKTTD